jgi:hypothetical protein
VNVAVPGVIRQNLEMSDINLRVGLRFQIGASVYRIQLISNDSIVAKCVYGARKGSDTLFAINAVTTAVLERL